MYRGCSRLKTITQNCSKNYSSNFINIHEEVRHALKYNKPVVALESTIITHGMPFPENVKCATEVEQTVRNQGAVPATIAVLNGKIKVGVTSKELERLGDVASSAPVKISRRDFPYVLANRLSGGTTVAGTLLVAKEAGIGVFATGGIGGVHRDAENTFDISADLIEMGRSNVAVVSSGVKSILDIPKTLEYLETQGVFVASLGPTADFPAFYSRTSGCRAPYHVETADQAANVIKAAKQLGLQTGLLFAVPIPEEYAIDSEIIEKIIKESLEESKQLNISGKDITPFLLSRIARVTGGRSLKANIGLVKNNAKTAADIAVSLCKMENMTSEGKDCVPEGSSSQEKRPVIIGGSNLDCCASLDTTEIEVDGRIYCGKFTYNAGGVGRNICEALSKLGCRPVFISAIGDDHQGRLLKSSIPKECHEHLHIVKGHSSAQCIIVLNKEGESCLLMGDMSIHSRLTPNLIKNNEDLIRKSPLLILDTNISQECIDTALQIATEHNVPVFLEPTDIGMVKKPFTSPNWRTIKYITPNLSELRQIGKELNMIDGVITKTSAVEEARDLSKKLAEKIDNVIVTLGPQGLIIARRGLAMDPLFNHKPNANTEISVRHYFVNKMHDLVNVNGAGDCLASGMITAMLHGLPEEACVSVGIATAKIALKSESPVPTEIFDFSHQSWKQSAPYKTLV